MTSDGKRSRGGADGSPGSAGGAGGDYRDDLRGVRGELRGELRGAMREVREAADTARSALGDVRDAVSGLGGLGGLLGDVVRKVADVETIKALADPTRLAILRALMDERGGPRVMSAKELAEELGEPQTKLYRHLKVLETARLIEAAETRLVSGIVETRYRAAQRNILLEDSALGEENSDDVLLIVAEAFDSFRNRVVANGRRGGFPLPRKDADQPRSAGMFTMAARIPADRAEELHARLSAVMEELQAEPSDSEGVVFEALLSWYVRVEDGADTTDTTDTKRSKGSTNGG